MKKIGLVVFTVMAIGVANVALSIELPYSFVDGTLKFSGRGSPEPDGFYAEYLYQGGIEVVVSHKGPRADNSRNYVTSVRDSGLGSYSEANASKAEEDTVYLQNFQSESQYGILEFTFDVPVSLRRVSLGDIQSDSDLQILYGAENGGQGRTDVLLDMPLGETSVNALKRYQRVWRIAGVPLNWDTNGLYPTTDSLVDAVLLDSITVDVEPQYFPSNEVVLEFNGDSSPYVEVVQYISADSDALSLDLSYRNASSNLFLFVYDQSGNILGSMLGGPSPVQLDVDVSEAEGPLELVVYNNSNDETRYELVVSYIYDESSSEQPGEEPSVPSLPSEIEPGYSRENSEGQLLGFYELPVDVSASGGSIEVNLSHSGESGNVSLFLYDEDGNMLLYQAGSSDIENFSYDVEGNPGSYQVVIYNNQTSTIDYSANVDYLP